VEFISGLNADLHARLAKDITFVELIPFWQFVAEVLVSPVRVPKDDHGTNLAFLEPIASSGLRVPSLAVCNAAHRRIHRGGR